MQPQDSQQPDYDFILKNQQPTAKSRVKLTSLSKPILVLIGAAAAVILLTIFALVSRGGGGLSQAFTSALAQGQEISRVSALVAQQSKDRDTQGLATTVKTSLDSDQSQILAYLTENKIKVDPKTLSTLQDKRTDEQLQSAAQINKLEQQYNSYLKTNLAKYQALLNTARTQVGKNGQAIIDNSATSTQTILSAPQLASAGN